MAKLASATMAASFSMTTLPFLPTTIGLKSPVALSVAPPVTTRVAPLLTEKPSSVVKSILPLPVVSVTVMVPSRVIGME